MKKLLNLKNILFVSGLVLVIYSIIEHFSSHEGLHNEDIFLLSGFVIVLYIVLSFTHKHYDKKEGVRGIVLAEFIHSLIDGVVVGTAFIIGPTAGIAALLAIFSHEIPKMIGTFLLIKSLTKSFLETIKYILLSVSGIPLVAFSILFLSQKIGSISEEFAHTIELVSIATLIVVIIRISMHSFRHRGHDHVECKNCE